MREALILCRRFLSAQAGVTAIEYCLIAALVAVVALTGIASLGMSLDLTFGNIGTAIGPVGAAQGTGP
ncbi:MAG TPA: Flp family type IVb pilin [Phenylobacterium sp.]|nr:Flp family type IVb pilin [Phenylobacterium sp.]